MNDNFLNETEKKSLEELNESPTTLQALKKILLANIYQEGTLIKGGAPVLSTKNFLLQKTMVAIQTNPNITDESLGTSLRADTQALRLMELAFQEIEKYKKVVTKKEKINDAI